MAHLLSLLHLMVPHLEEEEEAEVLELVMVEEEVEVEEVAMEKEVVEEEEVVMEKEVAEEEMEASVVPMQ